jgi:hypothetical protein
LAINFYPGTFGSKNEDTLGQGDVTLDMYDWDYFKTEFNKIHEKNRVEKRISTNTIINNKWFPGSHIDNYIAQPMGLNFVALGTLGDIHTYDWLNKYRPSLKKGDNAYFITVSNNFSNPNEIYKTKFKKVNTPTIIKQYRNNKPTRNMLVYLMEDYIGE